jgi:hypothetical protein
VAEKASEKAGNEPRSQKQVAEPTDSMKKSLDGLNELTDARRMVLETVKAIHKEMAEKASEKAGNEPRSQKQVAEPTDSMKKSLDRLKEYTDIRRMVWETVKAIETMIHDLVQEDKKGFWSDNSKTRKYCYDLEGKLTELSNRLDIISINSPHSANRKFAAALADTLSQAESVCRVAAESIGIPAYRSQLGDSIMYLERLAVTLLRSVPVGDVSIHDA